MPRTVGFEDPKRILLIRSLTETSLKGEAGIWKALAEELSRPRKNRREVNISRINEHTKEGEIVVVPGKVLGDGDLDHKITIAAYKFSTSAIEKINKSGGKHMTLNELMKANPQGSNVRIIG
jgi:large subunit ribosomal protein L18e